MNPATVYDTRSVGFDQARIASATLTSAGVVGWTVERALPGDGRLSAQLAQALANAQAICEAVGTRLQAASHLRVYVVGSAAEARQPLLEAIAATMRQPYPPITLIGVGSLAAPDLLVEIEFAVADIS